METWKSFATNEVTHSAAHYLMAIAELREKPGYARVSDVARHLGITKGSTSTEIKGLKARGLVAEDENRFLLLTEVGKRIVRQIVQSHRTLQYFLAKILRVEPEQAKIDACKIEHLLSESTTSKLLQLVQLLRSDSPAAKAFQQELDRFHFECKSNESCSALGDDCCLGSDECCQGGPQVVE